MEKLLKQAEEESFLLNHPYVGTEHLLLTLLKEEEIKEIVPKKLNYNNFKQKLIEIVGDSHIKKKYTLYTPLLKEIIDKSNSKKEMLINILSSDGIASSIIKIIIKTDNKLFNYMV